jgi:hypothetical protein
VADCRPDKIIRPERTLEKIQTGSIVPSGRIYLDGKPGTLCRADFQASLRDFKLISRRGKVKN